MAQHDFDFVMDYLEVRRADTYAQSDYKRQEKLAELDHIAELAMEIFFPPKPICIRSLPFMSRSQMWIHSLSSFISIASSAIWSSSSIFQR